MTKIRSYPLPVRSISRNTEDCVTIEFHVEEKLHDLFSFNAGQYLTIKTIIDGQELRRNYSLCSAPYEKKWEIAVKKQPGGRFSVFANQTLKENDILDIYPPMGSFTFHFHQGQENHYIAFASGSGITPVISLLKTSMQVEPKSHFTLFYGNRDRTNVIFLETLEKLKNIYINRLSLFHFFTSEKQESPLFNGRIDSVKCKELAKRVFNVSDIDTFFLCGPKNMMQEVTGVLTDLGVDHDKIRQELFTSIEMLGEVSHVDKNDAKPAKCEIVIIMEGRKTSYKFPAMRDTILDSALNSGADLPFACKGGVCCSCKALLIEGKVMMDKCYGLNDTERQKGYILTCQSRPVTPYIEVDYDAV